jgi:hypothetical protein
VVTRAPPPARARWRLGPYGFYVGLLSAASIFWLAVVSPIIRPTLPTHLEHMLFCTFAGIAIADAAAHAISDIAGIWKPHDLGGAQTPRQKFSVRKLLAADIRNLISHLSAVPVIGLVAYSYTLLSPHIEDRLFGSAVGQGLVFWNFLSQSFLGGIDVFGFFLSHETRAALRDKLMLVELSPQSFEAGAILAGLKLYGLLIFASTLRLVGAPIVIFRTWLSSRKRNRRRKRAEKDGAPAV